MKLQYILHERMCLEYWAFINKLGELPPEEIIDKAYEKVFKQEITFAIQEAELSDDVLEAFLTTQHPLEECYKAWLKRDETYMSEIRDTIEDYGKRLLSIRRRYL